MDLQVFRSIELFSCLDPVQLAHLASIVEEKAVPKETLLFEEGDQADYFYVIVKGRVRISKIVPGIGEEALAILNQGSYFGEMELIDKGVPRAAQAMTHEDCILHLFAVDDFHTMMGTEKDLAIALLWGLCRTLASRMRETNDKVTAMFAMAQFS
ncbi:MAG: cyclic nucleotide-binding domain-containing protein [Myxococcota bacterium]